MFLDNKYTKWYYNIIVKANERVDRIGYFENHHIIPKSLNGTNNVDNLIYLTAKEHFICHLLLTKMTQGEDKSKMVRAFWMIATMGNKNQERKKVKSRAYCLYKELWLKHGNLNKPKTEEHKQKLRKPKTEEHRKKLSIAKSGRSYGHRHTDETKCKMSEWQKGVSKPRKVCEHCGKESSLMNYTRWHGSNCKSHPAFVQRITPKRICEHCFRSVDLPNYAQWHGNNCKFKST